MAPPSQPLPIDPLIPRILSELSTERSLVLEAPPGAGKTTRVPRALLDSPHVKGQIVVLQPRRLPTRLAASRVAEELGERVGERVGYQIRFEDVSGPKTRLHFVTEGLLQRRLLATPTLPGVGAVVLDEFHERHLAGDVSLALLKRLQTQRPELKLLVMSATLEAGPVAAFLDGCKSLRSEGRRFPVTEEYLAAEDARHLDQQVLAAVKRVLQAGHEGDLLVFLPGAGEIRRSQEACQELCDRHGIKIHPLHGDLSPQEQDRAVRPSRERKLILSTNVAETSVTIEGVAVVIDSGVARVAAHSAWSGLPTLRLQKISRASATQRAGRAGRTRPGHCLRLYTKGDFDGRPEHDAPEIRRLDLAETVLQLRALGIRDLAGFPFFERPPEASLAAADDLLRRLSATDKDGGLTPLGKRLLQFPLHPRIGRLVVEAESRGVGSEGAAVAALLSERDIRRDVRTQFGKDRAAAQALSGPSDVLELLEKFRRAEDANFSSDRLRNEGLDPGAVQSVDRVRKQLSRNLDRGGNRPSTLAAREQAVMIAVTAAFPDRIAKRRRPKSAEVVMADGGSATLSEQSVVREPELLVAVDAEERPQGAQVRIASAVEPEWLIELQPDRLTEVDRHEWNESGKRVDRVTGLYFGKLALEETRQPAPASEETSKVLAEAARQAGVGKLIPAEALAQWRARVDLVRGAFPDKGFPATDDSLIGKVIAEACVGRRNFSELEDANLLSMLDQVLTPDQARLLRQMTPEKVELPGGRMVKVSYEPGKPPFLESRLQDFFGMAVGPAVCAGRVPIVLHLLAPNHRAVQVTTDLAGFWTRHYPSIRKELMRQYPRHSWPEDGRTAQTPASLGKKR